jgi:hypothetical protein
MKDKLIEKLYEVSKKPYQKFFKKNQPWTISKTELLQHNQESLGFHLGCFLIKYNFNVQPSLEEHDVYHVLTNTGITVKDEIDMQFYLLGNGKKSPFVFMVITTGLFFYPFQIKKFINSYKKGKNSYHFYDLDFSKMLNIPVHTIQETFKIQ